MPITESQRINRRKNLGSSDMAAIMGCDKWRSAGDVFLEKTGRIVSDIHSEAATLGTALEDGVLDAAVAHTGPVVRNVARRVKDSRILAHIDAIQTETGMPIEIKTCGLTNFVAGKEWGETDIASQTDNVPARVIIQASCHIAATGADACKVIALIAGRGLSYYTVGRSERLLSSILEAADRFWHENVAKEIMPNDPPSLHNMMRIERSEEAVDLDPTMMEEYASAKETCKQGENLVKDVKQRIVAALGDAKIGDFGDGRSVEIKTIQRREYTVKSGEYQKVQFRKTSR